MVHCLHVTVDGTAQPRVEGSLKVAVKARRLNISLLRHQNKEICFGGLRDEIELAENIGLYVLGGSVNDKF